MYTALFSAMPHHCATSVFAAASSCANIMILGTVAAAVSILLPIFLGSAPQAVKTRCKLQ